MASVLDQAKSVLPSINVGNLGNFAYMAILTILVLVIVIGIFGLWMWWYISKKKFNKKIIIWGKVDGRPKIIGRDAAMERKIGTGGDTIFYWRKQKRMTPRGEIQTGDNTYWYTQRQDGEMINIGLEDFDLKYREAGINYLDKETRYARASLQKLNKDRFNKETWWQKYGNMLMSIVFIVLVSVMLLLIMSKMAGVIGSIDQIMKSSTEVMDKAAQVLGTVDKVCTTSGVTPA